MIAGLRPVLIEVLEYLDRDDCDIGWGSTREPPAARLDYRDHLRRIEQGDVSRIWDLMISFAPTGELQETSMASGWAERYIELATTFDNVTSVLGPFQPPEA